MKARKSAAATLLLGLWLTGCMSGGAPNDTVKRAFTTKFGQVASVSWSHNSDYSYAHFTQGGKPVVAVFGNDGLFIATEPAKPIQ
ncbi:hypothetical protein BN8_02961 [Fibrisoma limi BUZ 3]|uniref:Lipoprotein n=1 Tax=Fibrisoma limi BUZ 3 TaxID=1185876 RepID=I2GIV7_9BACT|nr:hypothetical protein [Fibrisoma limi]CCH53832.1 hypothetical protein BN8_02961 [Fibrisoma limi BUZ 3]